MARRPPGSSPRVWGRPWIPSHPSPATCGSSPRVWGRRHGGGLGGSGLAVHPHACGADPVAGQSPTWRPTVHPHACGADYAEGGGCWEVRRFIPTRVGQTVWGFLLAPCTSSGSSPRVWGRLRSSRGRPIRLYGSSPRVWGRLWFGSAADRTYRFIPTRVGQTRSARCWPGPGAGSSPRVWGRHATA